MSSLLRRLIVFAAVLVAAPLVMPGRAHAGEVSAAALCTPQETSRTFERFRDLENRFRALTIGRIGGGGDWTPSPVLPVIANLLSLATGKPTDVQFRFTARGEGSAWQVDGVYVDPWGKD